MYFLRALLLIALPGIASAASWQDADPANTLLIETTKGRIAVEMRPDLAPRAVARIILLSREHLYDGLLFHRVIDGFVDQTGNPNNKDGGASTHPDLAPEFIAPLASGSFVPVTHAIDGFTGFLGALPIAGAEDARGGGHGLVAWGAYCAGVAGMGRQADIGSANSEIFFTRAPARRLDHDYTVWGQVILGLDVVRAIAVGVPPARPDRMLRVRLLADIPAAGRPNIQRLDPRDPSFIASIRQARAARGADFSICDLAVPARIAP